MTTVAKNDIVRTLRALGVRNGDLLLVHSSMKSMGYVEGGPDTVIDALLEGVGARGTLLMPALVQRDFAHAYTNWNRDTSPSDVGLITETFRNRKGVLRSDQATHSVTALGPLAYEMTHEHGQSGRRLGVYGDTPFSADSPWEKLARMGGKILFLGVTLRVNTLHHLAEYRQVESILRAASPARRSALMTSLRYRCGDEAHDGIWPYLGGDAMLRLQEEWLEEGVLCAERCGDAMFLLASAEDMLVRMENAIQNKRQDLLAPEVRAWLETPEP